METGPPAGLQATISVPAAAAARAASPIFPVMLSVVLGLMTLIRMAASRGLILAGPIDFRPRIQSHSGPGRRRPASIRTGGFRMSRTLSIPARPEALPLEPGRTAVVVVDMQNAFAFKGGYLDRSEERRGGK